MFADCKYPLDTRTERTYIRYMSWTEAEIEAFESDAPRCCKCGDIVSALDTAVIGLRGLECSGCAGPEADENEGSV